MIAGYEIGYENGYKLLLEKVIASHDVENVLAKLYCNTNPEMPLQKLSKEYIETFKSGFEPEYERLQKKLYDLTSILFTNLYPGEPQITLIRWGQAGKLKSKVSDTDKPLMTDYTGRWGEIVNMSDEELTFSHPEIPSQNLQGMYFLVKKSALEYRTLNPKSELVDHFTTRMKAEDRIAHKIVRRFFGIDDQDEDRIKSIDSITDIGGIKIVVPTQDKCYEMFNFLKAMHPKVTIPEETLKDYIKKPKKNGYQALHLNVEIVGQWLEVQIRDLEMDRRTEYDTKINHATYEERKMDLLEEKNMETGGRVFATMSELNRILQSREGYLVI